MSPHVDSASSSSSSVCEEVCVLLSSIVDGRATPAEAAYANAHMAHCSECASQYAFMRATKTVWARQPMAMPPLDLSARIAAATYAKPTFAQRFASFFAVLQPAPIRVAVGMAAVAGIAFLIAPRLELGHPAITPQKTPIAIKEPEAPVDTNKVATTTPKQITKQSSTVASAPKQKPQPAVAIEKSAVAINTEVARKEVKPQADTVPMAPIVASAPKPTEGIKTHSAPHSDVSKPPVQVASAVRTPRPNVVHEHTTPQLSSNDSGTPDVTPSHDTEVATTTIPTVTTPVENPDIKEPVARVAAVTPGMTVSDPDPASNDGPRRLSNSLKNIGKATAGYMGGKANAFAQNNIATTAFIVDAPINSVH